jgi:hypothetical protein
MAFTGNEGEMIDPKTAQQMIDNYRKDIGPNDTRAEFFGFRRISELLGQGQAIGIRIYLGKNDKGEIRLMMCAVTAEEKNIAPIDGTTGAGMVLEMGDKCPPYCNVAD